MALVSVAILSSILQLPALSISTTITEGPGALSDFIAISAVYIILRIISGGGPSTVKAFSNIAASQRSSMLSKRCDGPAKQ